MSLLARIVLRLVSLAIIIAVVAHPRPWDARAWRVWLVHLARRHLLRRQHDPRPVLRLLGLPLIVVALGLFLRIISAALLGITAELSSHLAVGSFALR